MDDISPIRTSATSSAPSPAAAPRPRRLGSAALVGLALVLALAAIPACSHGAQASGTPLPDATLHDLTTGKATSWSADGKPLVVNFWASWCTPCRKEMPAFEQVSKQVGDRVRIVGVTDEEDLTKAKKAAATAGVTYPLLVDVDQTLLSDVGITGLPGTVFVDAKGEIVGRHLGALTADQLTKEIEKRYGITP